MAAKHPRKNLLWSSLSNKQTCQNKKASKPRGLNISSRKKNWCQQKTWIKKQPDVSISSISFDSQPLGLFTAVAWAAKSSWNFLGDGVTWVLPENGPFEKEISWNFIVFRVYVSFQGGRIHGTGIQYLDLAPRMQLWQIKGLFLNVSRHLVVTGPLNRDLFWCRGAVFYNYWLNYWEGKISQDLHGRISSHGLFLDERFFILHTHFKLHVFDMFWCLLQWVNKDVKREPHLTCNFWLKWQGAFIHQHFQTSRGTFRFAAWRLAHPRFWRSCKLCTYNLLCLKRVLKLIFGNWQWDIFPMAINLLFKSVLIVVFKGQNSAGDMNVPIRKELRIQTQNYHRHKTFETNLILAT